MESNKISSPQGTQPAHAARSRSTANAQEAAPTDGSGGFLALLAALGAPGQGEEPLVELAEGVDAIPGGAPEGQDLSSLVAWQTLLPAAVTAGTDTVTSQGAQAGAAGTVAAAPGLGAPGFGIYSGSSPFPDAPFDANGMPQGLVAETAVLDATFGPANGPLQMGSATHGRAFSRAQNALAQKADAVDLSSGRQQAGAGLSGLPGHLGAALASLQVPAERSVGASVLGMADRDARDLSGAAAESGVGSLLTDGAVPAAFSAGAGAGAGRSGDARPEGGAWLDGAGTSAPEEAGFQDGATVFAEPGQPGQEEHVAEQVAYWVNQKTQNAELTLNRDGQPVEVSVTLSGNEAHVSFRSDQPQTRELLDKSMAQLSELLRSEGLVLSGMSVGTSAGQREHGGGSDQPGQREGTRQARVTAGAPSGSAPLLRTGSTDRAVDVFV